MWGKPVTVYPAPGSVKTSSSATVHVETSTEERVHERSVVTLGLASNRSVLPRSTNLRWFAALTLILLVLSELPSLGLGADRTALWQVVSNLCVPAQQRGDVPFPCQSVDLQRGFAVLKVASSHFLLVPTAKLAGIESPQLLEMGSQNYWDFAWEAWNLFPAGDHLGRDDVGLAINSARARTQDQLHINIGCIRPDVKAALQIYERDLSKTWSRLPFGVGGQRYRVMRLDGDTLGAANPFALLADGIRGARQDMASQTLVVAGARFRDGGSGFYILAAHSDNGRAASGEGLLDYGCRVSRRLN